VPRPRAVRLTDERAGWLAVIGGAALAFAVQVLAPVGVPLYDGVAVEEPYRYIRPMGGQAGSPTSFSATIEVVDGTSPQIAAVTAEVPAQAQLILSPGALVLPSGTTSLNVSVTPIEPPPAARGGEIAGNVYRFSVTDQLGRALALKPCNACAVVLRAPENTGSARLQRYADGAWSDVETIHAGVVGMYAASPTELGDYAVVTGGASGQEPGGADGAIPTPLLVAAGIAVIVVLVLAAALVLRGRSRSSVAAPARDVASSKRKKRRKPPAGRPQR